MKMNLMKNKKIFNAKKFMKGVYTRNDNRLYV